MDVLQAAIRYLSSENILWHYEAYKSGLPFYFHLSQLPAVLIPPKIYSYAREYQCPHYGVGYKMCGSSKWDESGWKRMAPPNKPRGLLYQASCTWCATTDSERAGNTALKPSSCLYHVTHGTSNCDSCDSCDHVVVTSIWLKWTAKELYRKCI